MGRGRPKKRSPNTSESLTLQIGAEAELRSDVPGFLGSFYEVTITGHLVSSSSYTVVYSTLMAADGRPLQVTAAAADVRPRPPRSARRVFAVHDTVEALHKRGWWAGVVSSIPRPGVYEVAFPTSRETIEFEETALRPHRVFQAGRWVPAAELKSANVPTLASQKRSVPSALSVHKEVGETSDEHGSYHEKKLKKAAVVPAEPIPPPSSVCNESYDIKRKPSSYPEETTKKGNAVLAPPSLPPTAGFSDLSDSSLAQSSHLEQAPSWKIIIPSAPVAAPQSRQLQASLFGTFGQPRPLPQGPLLRMRSLNPQTPNKVIAAKSIDEARNTISNPAKPKNGDDNVELHYNVAAGCGVLSETNAVTCVDPTATASKDIGGSQHAVSQRGRGSAMDSESLAIQDLPPFGKTSTVWAMQPEDLNNLFQQHCPEFREGMAAGLMLACTDLAESMDGLDVHHDNIVQGKKHGLCLLEENGFDVRALRSRLEDLVCTTTR